MERQVASDTGLRLLKLCKFMGATAQRSKKRLPPGLSSNNGHPLPHGRPRHRLSPANVLRIGLCALLLIVAVDLRSGLDVKAGLVLESLVLEDTAGFGIGRALRLNTGSDACRMYHTRSHVAHHHTVGVIFMLCSRRSRTLPNGRLRDPRRLFA